MTPRLLYRYDRRKVRLMILGAQGMGIIALYWTTRVVEIGPHRGMVLHVIFLTLPILIYLAFFAFTVMAYVRRDLVAIYEDGMMVTKSFRNHRVKLPAGTIVDYDDERLKLNTDLPKVWFAKNKGGVVTLPMPNGLYPVGKGRFQIGKVNSSPAA